MGKKSKSETPPLPDINQLIGAQSNANEQNMSQGIAANRLNTVTPYGSITYSGGTGPNGVYGQTQNVSLDPNSQAVLTSQQEMAKALAAKSNGIVGQINLDAPDMSGLTERKTSLNMTAPNLPTPESFAGERSRIEGALFDRQKALIDPVFNEQRSRTTQDLANRGFDLERSQGSQSEFNRLDRSQNEAYGNAANDAIRMGGDEFSRMYGAALSGRNQNLSEEMAGADLANKGRESEFNENMFLRGLPFQDMQALNSVMPNLPSLAPQNPYTKDTAPVDAMGGYLGLANAQDKRAAAEAQSRGGFLSGLFGVAQAALPFIASDRRLKKNVKEIGKTHDGIALYKWEWNDKAKEIFGLEGASSGCMADEVYKIYPDCVRALGFGYDGVDYGKLFKKFREV